MSEKLNDYMFDFIEQICKEIGPRESASEPEHKAGDKIEEILKVFCDETDQEEFVVHPRGSLGFVRYGAIMTLCAMVLYWVSLLSDFKVLKIMPAINLLSLSLAVVFVTFAMVYFVFEVMRGYELVDELFPEKTAKNVIGTIEPKTEVKNTIIVSAHHDSAYEFNLFYYLKIFGAVAIFLGLIGVALASVFVWLKFLCFFLGIEYTQIFYWFGIIMLCFSPIALLFVFFISKKAVLGAYDNLSGVAILLGLAKYYSENEPLAPKSTRIKLVSFACEEAGLRGSKRFVKAHLKELKTQSCKVINIDSVAIKDKIVITKNEITIGAKHDKQLTQQLLDIGKKLNIGVRFGPLPFGATDAVPFTKNRIPATTLMTYEMPRLPKYYHTRNDAPKVVDKEALGQVLSMCVEFINQLDK